MTSENQRVRGSDGRFVRAGTPSLPLSQPSDPKGRGLEDIVTQARTLAGEEWGTIRSWPLESGLIFLADRLKG